MSFIKIIKTEQSITIKNGKKDIFFKNKNILNNFNIFPRDETRIDYLILLIVIICVIQLVTLENIALKVHINTVYIIYYITTTLDDFVF